MKIIGIKCIGFCILIMFLSGFYVENPQSNLPKDAIAIWNMADAKNTISKTGDLTAVGNVKIGVKLKTEESEIALHHGGDGVVASFNGGYLVAGNNKLQLTGKEMTLCIRMSNQSEKWDIPIFTKNDPVDPFSSILVQKDGMLKYIWQTSPARERVSPDWFKNQKNLPVDFFNGILRIGVPVDMIGNNAWHDIVVRFHDTILEMFIDGVLVDEEWTHGSLYKFQGPFLIGAANENGEIKSGFNGMVDHVALWNRALSDDEVIAISGGKEFVAKRDLEILGPEQASLQYWHPRGYNTSAGDVMCLFNEGTFHVFWLYDRRHHGSKWIMGAHQYAHVTTRNLVNWTHLPLAVPLIRSWESAMGTGDFIVNNGIFYAFYTDCGSRVEFPEKPHIGSGIFMATSNDGVIYKKGERPVIEGGDCSIFHDDKTNLFYLVKNGKNEQGQTGLVYYTSPDLNNWTMQKDLLLIAGGACPHLFKWGSWYYLSVSAKFWRSPNVTGPWTPNLPARISQLSYPKTAEFTGGRRIAGGWIGDKGWGGDLAFFELIQNADGSLGTKFVPEMIPASGNPLNLSFCTSYSWLAVHPRVSAKDSLRLTFMKPQKESTAAESSVLISAKDGFKAAMLDKIPQNVRITMIIKPSAGAKSFGLCMRGIGDYDKGCELKFDVPEKRIQYGEPQNGGPEENLKENIALNEIDGLDKSFTLDVIITGTIIDACIDNRQTLITRNYENIGDRLFFFAKNGEVTFEDIKVCPLLNKN